MTRSVPKFGNVSAYIHVHVYSIYTGYQLTYAYVLEYEILHWLRGIPRKLDYKMYSTHEKLPRLETAQFFSVSLSIICSCTQCRPILVSHQTYTRSLRSVVVSSYYIWLSHRPTLPSSHTLYPAQKCCHWLPCIREYISL